MAKFIRSLILTSSLALLLASCSTLKPPSHDKLIKDDYSLVKKYMAKVIKREMKRGDITGLSIALIDDQNIVWSQGFGLADKASKREAQPETLYRAGSVSKLLTAIAVMQQVEAGNLSLDAPLVQSVPEFRLNSRFGSTDSITLRNILSHHSGVPGTLINDMWAANPPSFKTVAGQLGNYYAANPPNTVFAYSNAGYTLAGHAVENASGEPFSDYAEQAILSTLGMHDSNFSLDTSDPLLASSYWEGKEVQELSLRDIPAGGLITNVTDLSRLVMAMHSLQAGNPGILQPESFAAMTTPEKFDSPYVIDNQNGLGFFVNRGFLNGQYIAAGHDGQTMAHSASLISIPELKLGVVILGNSPNISGAYQKISAELLKVAYPVKTGRSLDSSFKTAKTPLPGIETTFNGDYISELGFIQISGNSPNYTVRVNDEKLYLKPDKTGAHKLSVKLLGFIPLSPDELNRLRFYAREVSGQKILYLDSGTHRQLIASQAETQPENKVWHTRLGDYSLTNPIDTDIDLFNIKLPVLIYKDGYYMLASKSPKDKSRFILNIINDNEATLQGIGRGLGETVFARDDGTVELSGLIFKKED